MNKLAFVIFLNLAVIISLIPRNVIAGEPTYMPPKPSIAVGVVELDWPDESRNRNVPAKIYFPKEGNGPFPIVIFSHGLGGSRNGYEYLGRHWAGCGYVSVHIQHIGSDDSVWKDVPVADRGNALQKSAAIVANATNRPLDVKFAADQIEKLQTDEASPLQGRLDLKSMAVAGHSFGGYTTLAVAGQTFLFPLGITKNYGDPRIKAGIQMSGPASANRRELDKIYSTISIPVMHMTGTKDFLELLPQTTAADRRIPFDHMSRSETCLVIFNEGDHFIFSGREGLPSAAQRREEDAEFHKLIIAGTTAFWDAYLKENAAAKKWLLEGGYRSLLGNHATFEVKSPAQEDK
jgi:predicted dienelactone hydrolase